MFYLWSCGSQGGVLPLQDQHFGERGSGEGSGKKPGSTKTNSIEEAGDAFGP